MNDFHPDRRPFQRPPRRFLSFLLTVAVHVGLLTFLFFGVNWQSKPLGSLEVGLVGAPSAPSPAPAPPAPPPEPPKPEPPKPEPPPQPKPEIATKAPEPPKPEKKPEPKPEPKPKPPEPPLKPIDLQKQLEQKLNQEIERRDEAKRVNELLDGPQGSSNQRAGNPGELDAYRTAIAAKVRRNLTAPPGSGNPSAVFEIEQVMGSRGGEVINVKLKQSSGNHALDEAIERAIRKSDPLPPPDDPALFRRKLEITFRPLEE
jgi:colicin import membrane protein